MGLFDLFKKKKTDLPFPANELEHCLMDGLNSTVARKEFFQKLLWNDLHVLTGDEPIGDDRDGDPDASSIVKFVSFEGGEIPVFTSINRIFDKGIISGQVPQLKIRGQDLFKVTRGHTIVINPYSDYVIELSPEQIEDIMDGSIYDKIDEEEIQDKKNAEFNELFTRAGKSQEGLILLGGYRPKPLNSSEKARLEASIGDFAKCVEMAPYHWQSRVLMAKALQRLEKHAEALEQLEMAFEHEKATQAIPMEAALEAMHLKQIDKALFYSAEALKINPKDHVLMGNHAMNLLIGGKDDEAMTMAEKALAIQPTDAVNLNLRAIIKDVLTGNRKRPTFEELMS